jgi:hypothetical protein
LGREYPGVVERNRRTPRRSQVEPH